MTSDCWDVAGERLEQQIMGPVVEVLQHMPEAVAAVEKIAFESIRQGEACSPALIARGTGRAEVEIRDALRLMASVGAARLDTAGSVVGIQGLSVEPTQHRLRLDGVDLYTWCAIDALGIPVALGVVGLVSTPCAECGRELRVAVRGGHVQADGEPVAWCPTTSCTNVADELCRQVNLFCDRGHLETWRARSGASEGLVFSVADIEENGRRVWGARARGPAGQ